MIILGSGADDAANQPDETSKGVIFKKCAPPTDCINVVSLLTDPNFHRVNRLFFFRSKIRMIEEYTHNVMFQKQI